MVPQRATLKSISRNRANLIAPPYMPNVGFNIGRYSAEQRGNKSGNSIRYFGTTIHRKRLIFTVVIHQRNIADHAWRPSTFSSPVRNGINFARDLQHAGSQSIPLGSKSPIESSYRSAKEPICPWNLEVVPLIPLDAPRTSGSANETAKTREFLLSRNFGK